MQRRVIRRATAAALTVLLLTTVVAYADTVPADGDALTTGNQSLVDLGEAAPGQVLTWSVDFHLTCAGLSHVAAGATLAIAQSSATKPLDGTVSATPTTIGPVPDEWTPADEGCPSPAPMIRANASSIVTLTMPTKPGVGYPFTVAWSRLGGSGVTGTTAITLLEDEPRIDLASVAEDLGLDGTGVTRSVARSIRGSQLR